MYFVCQLAMHNTAQLPAIHASYPSRPSPRGYFVKELMPLIRHLHCPNQQFFVGRNCGTPPAVRQWRTKMPVTPTQTAINLILSRPRTVLSNKGSGNPKMRTQFIQLCRTPSLFIVNLHPCPMSATDLGIQAVPVKTFNSIQRHVDVF